MRFGKLTLVSIVALSVVASLAHAQVIAGGSGGGNSIPFGGPFGTAYQQVYSSTDFSGIVNITSIAFASSSAGPPPASGPATYNISVGLSNTSKAVNGLSTDFNANRGPNSTTVFNGTLTRTLLFTNTFDLVIPSSGFTYNPALGNLLVDVFVNAPPQTPGGRQIFFDYGVSPDSSRLSNYQGASTDNHSLHTSFVTNAVVATPEPGTFGLIIGVSVSGLAVCLRRRRHNS